MTATGSKATERELQEMRKERQLHMERITKVGIKRLWSPDQWRSFYGKTIASSMI